MKDQEMTMNYPRKKILVNKPYQLGFTILMISVIFIVVVIAILTIHYSLLATLINRVYQAGTMPNAKELVDLAMKPLLIVIPVVIFLFAVLILYFIYLSHRTAGPLHQLKNAMDRVGQGDFSTRVKFRRNDNIKDVEESFNRMVENLKGKTEKGK
jgi:nitrogen fixation/metabolism regulation signal transduction histidine kinase